MESRERRYPPTPYRPRSEATALYRDGWDLGWEHMGAAPGRVLAVEAELSGPKKHGYRDGAVARYARELRQAEAEKRAAREARSELRSRELWLIERAHPAVDDRF